MLTKTITICGEEYEVAELPLRKNSAWRKRLQQEFTEISDVLTGAPEIEIGSFDDLGGLVRSLSANLIGSVDRISELLFDYSPVLAENRTAIEDSAYESEMLDAFIQVLGLAFPFGTWAGKLAGLARELGASGSPEAPTSTSSAGPSGDSGATS